MCDASLRLPDKIIAKSCTLHDSNSTGRGPSNKPCKVENNVTRFRLHPNSGFPHQYFSTICPGFKAFFQGSLPFAQLKERVVTWETLCRVNSTVKVIFFSVNQPSLETKYTEVQKSFVQVKFQYFGQDSSFPTMFRAYINVVIC